MFSSIHPYLPLVIYPILALILSLILTRVSISILPHLGYVDKPGGRHIHAKPIPRGGGIAVIIAFFMALAAYTLHGMSTEIPGMARTVSQSGYTLLERLFYPSILLVGLGLIDDRFNLKSWIKLGVQIVVALMVWYMGQRNYYLSGHLLPWYVGLVITIVWVIIIVNAFNLIDGLDGLASGLAVVSSICLAIWFLMNPGHRAEAVTLFVLACSCLGFLRYNFHPAKIFLGDTGSTFIGLAFAVIGLSTQDKTVTFTSLLLPALAAGVPLFDVGLAIWRRGTRKLLDPEAKGIMDADQDHLHHRLLRQTLKQGSTAVRMYVLATVFGAIALVAVFLHRSLPAIAYMMVLAAVLLIIRQLAGIELLNSAKLIRNGISKPRTGLFVHLAHPFIDLTIIFISFVTMSWLAMDTFKDYHLMVFLIVPTMAVLLLSGIYRIYWLRAGSESYLHLAASVFFGSILSCVVLYLFYSGPLWGKYGIGLDSFTEVTIVFTMLNVAGICGERFMLHYMESYWMRKTYLKNLQQERLRKTVIYGGGLKCRLYVNYLYCARMGNIREEIIGIVDDNRSLRGLKIYNFNVLGNIQELELIWAKHKFDKLVVAISNIDGEKLEELRRFSKEHEIEFMRFSVRLDEEYLPGATAETVSKGERLPSDASVDKEY